MRRVMAICAALALCVPCVAGCDRKAQMEKSTTVEGPGGETTTTHTTTVESSGENPPAADGQAVPPK